MKPVRFTRLTEQEVQQAAAWYERRSEGLGDRFLRGVLEALDNIARNPEGYAMVTEGLRRCMVPRFQNALWFRVETEEIVVIACLHSKRSPRLLKERAAGVLPIRSPENSES